MEALRSYEEEHRISLAAAIMDGFAKNTGFETGEGEPTINQTTLSRRYLYTDALALQNFLRLYQLTAAPRYKELSLKLVDSVHISLGHFRPDDERRGWLSGLPEDQGARSPTIAGLRIGKRFPERPEGEPENHGEEWERDGQYFHYLTRWMDALLSAGKILKKDTYILWAQELCLSATETFVRFEGTGPTMSWKMSTDLSRPLVATMGAQDPLEGYLHSRALELALSQNRTGLKLAQNLYAKICKGKNWSGIDPLGIGMLLLATRKSMRLPQAGMPYEATFEKLLSDSIASLEAYTHLNEPLRPIKNRLAFRECGLAMGLRSMEGISELSRFIPLADEIEEYWSRPTTRDSSLWLAHQDINDVTLAASLCHPFE